MFPEAARQIQPSAGAIEAVTQTPVHLEHGVERIAGERGQFPGARHNELDSRAVVIQVDDQRGQTAVQRPLVDGLTPMFRWDAARGQDDGLGRLRLERQGGHLSSTGRPGWMASSMWLMAPQPHTQLTNRGASRPAKTGCGMAGLLRKHECPRAEWLGG